MEKGICFRYDDRYYPGHKCKNRQFRVMIASEDEGEDSGEVVGEEEEVLAAEKEMELSLNSSSMEGISRPKTMKFKGKIKDRVVVILLDSGATHSFISRKVVEELNLPISTAKFAVTLGDERKVKGAGKCQQVELWFQRVSVTQDLFFFYLGSVDVILGVDWLYKLGDIKINWKRQTMRFNWGGCRMELKGDLSLNRVESTFKALMNSLIDGGEGYLVELGRKLCTEE